LFAYGPDELIKQVNEIITKNNSDDSEITVLKKGEMNSVLSVSRTKSIFEVDESIYFFKGWFQDHEAQSIVLGEKGFQDWLKRQGEVHDSIDFEGAYVSAKIKNDTLTVSNDTFSYFPVIYFVSDDLFVCSDSLFVLSELRKGLGMPCTLNKKTIDTRAWTHGLACAPMSNETQIEGVELLSPGKSIEFSLGGSISEKTSIKIPKNVVKSKNLNEMFRMDFDDYTKAIRDAAKKIAESTVSLIQLEDVFIQFGLSGGLDSRIILAAILQKP
jgi:asparagine synthetase B (glutamine-hydrolysing)